MMIDGFNEDDHEGICVDSEGNVSVPNGQLTIDDENEEKSYYIE